MSDTMFLPIDDGSVDRRTRLLQVWNYFMPDYEAYAFTVKVFDDGFAKVTFDLLYHPVYGQRTVPLEGVKSEHDAIEMLIRQLEG